MHILNQLPTRVSGTTFTATLELGDDARTPSPAPSIDVTAHLPIRPQVQPTMPPDVTTVGSDSCLWDLVQAIIDAIGSFFSIFYCFDSADSRPKSPIRGDRSTAPVDDRRRMSDLLRLGSFAIPSAEEQFALLSRQIEQIEEITDKNLSFDDNQDYIESLVTCYESLIEINPKELDKSLACYEEVLSNVKELLQCFGYTFDDKLALIKPAAK